MGSPSRSQIYVQYIQLKVPICSHFALIRKHYIFYKIPLPFDNVFRLSLIRPLNKLMASKSCSRGKCPRKFCSRCPPNRSRPRGNKESSQHLRGIKTTETKNSKPFKTFFEVVDLTNYLSLNRKSTSQKTFALRTSVKLHSWNCVLQPVVGSRLVTRFGKTTSIIRN